MKYFDRSQILSVFNDEGEAVFRKRAKKKITYLMHSYNILWHLLLHKEDKVCHLTVSFVMLSGIIQERRCLSCKRAQFRKNRSK